MVVRTFDRIDLRLSLPDHGGPQGELVATVSLPRHVNGVPTVMFCAHGGTYNRRYWDFDLTGNESYSFAKYMSDRGAIVVAWDALGHGESRTSDDPWRVTSLEVALAGHILVEEVTRRLLDGTLTATLPRLEAVRRLGVGHSLGGMTVVRQQARHHSFDAIAVLGWTNLERSRAGYIADHEVSLEAALAELVEGRSPEEAEASLFQLRDQPTLADFEEYRASQRDFFYWGDEPSEVVAADAAAGRPRLGAMWVVSRIPGIVLADTARVDVPVFLGYGERDISVDPSSEPSFYKASRDVTLHILRGSAHCHNFSSVRALQWERVRWWDKGIYSQCSKGKM